MALVATASTGEQELATQAVRFTRFGSSSYSAFESTLTSYAGGKELAA